MSRCPFLSCHLNNWPDPWWIFGTPAIFVKFAFSQYFPLCRVTHLIWGFARPLMDSCPIPRFLKFSIFVKVSMQLSICLFCCLIVSILAKFAGFVNPTIIDMPLLSSCLNFWQICHFYEIVICQDIPFCHLICIWPNPWTVHFCRDLPFSPKFAMFLL